MDKESALGLVRKYKALIADNFGDADVYMYGSYSKGTANEDSDIDVAIVVPELKDDWWTMSVFLWKKTHQVSTLIEPVIIETCKPSPLYQDILKTGMLVS